MDCYHQLFRSPDINVVHQTVSWLEHIALREKWPARIVFILTLCLDEALTNVVSYAFDPPVAEPVVYVSCLTSKEKIVLTLRDNGCPYDPTAATPPPLASSLDDAVPGGHGMRLMRHYSHDIVYCRKEKWNQLSISISIPDTPLATQSA